MINISFEVDVLPWQQGIRSDIFVRVGRMFLYFEGFTIGKINTDRYMQESFYIGYDLEKARFDFTQTDSKTSPNTVLLNEIADDFTKIAVSKAGLLVNKEELINRLSRVMSSVSNEKPIVVLSVTRDGNLKKEFINRNSSLFKELFDE